MQINRSDNLVHVKSASRRSCGENLMLLWHQSHRLASWFL